MVQVIRETEKFMSLGPWKGFVGGLFGDLASATTDAQITQYIRNYAITIDHMAGTARMSPTNATSGVTDSRLKVKGAQGLRIVDASVFVSRPCFVITSSHLTPNQPKIPECHTQAVVYTLVRLLTVFDSCPFD
jgi:choline dehydrogenase-like flavoprotein